MHSKINGFIFGITALITLVLIYFYSIHNYYLDGDALGYYQYLPSTFIYHNNGHPEIWPEKRNVYPHIIACFNGLARNKTATGYVLPSYTYGVAAMEAPFFFVACACDLLRGRAPGGYSYLYNLSLIAASFVYMLLGLALVYTILRKYFSGTVALLTVCLLLLGTNTLWFSLFRGGMCHIPLFFLYALLMLVTMRLYERPRWLTFIAVGGIAGFITIIRPVDVLCITIPLLYGVHSKKTLLLRMKFISDHRLRILAAVAAFVLPVLPQLAYWKKYAGSFFYYSYRDQGFNWQHPKIIEGLFEYNNGWLAYSPIFLFALVGLLLYKTIKQWAWCICFILPPYIYVIYSWWCYNYINGLGSRPMIHLYPLLAIPFAAFISFVAKRRWLTKAVFGVCCMFFIALNIANSMQYSRGILIPEQSNLAFNAQLLFRQRLNYNDLVVADVRHWQPDTTRLTKVAVLAYLPFNDSIVDRAFRDPEMGNRFVYHMAADEFTKDITITYTKQQFGDARWLKCSGTFQTPEAPDYFKHLLVLTTTGDKLWMGCTIENKIAFQIKGTETKLNDFVPQLWGNVWFFAKIPDNMNDGDKINLLVWNTGRRELFIDHICLELYK